MRLVLTAARDSSIVDNWLSEVWVAQGDPEPAWRDVIFDDAAHPRRTQVLWRPALPAGMDIVGPVVIEEPNSTIFIHPGDRVSVTGHGHLIVAVADGSQT